MGIISLLFSTRDICIYKVPSKYTREIPPSALCIGEALALSAGTVGIMFFCKYDDLHTSGNAHFVFQKPTCMSVKFLCSLKSLRISPRWIPNLYASFSPSQTCLSMYLCFYNIIIMCSRLSANQMLIQSLIWCCNSIVTHGDDWSLYYIISLQHHINDYQHFNNI